MKFPRASEQDPTDGFVIDLEYLEKIQKFTRRTNYSLSYADIELVLLALESLGDEALTKG